MSDPAQLTDALDAARDSFRHAHGAPTFEPTINAGVGADDGEVQIQKACRLIEAATVLEESGDYHGSVLEHAFATIERTLEGYLIAFGDYEVADFHDHTRVYERGHQQVPLTSETLDTL